jgi:alkylation response protein AidB-like acyl-CoA dehydrogenase
VKQFIRARLPSDVSRRGLTGFHSSRADQLTWGRMLFEQGWSAPAWPKAYGGAGWTPAQVQIFDEECYLAGAPELSWNGIRLVGPVIFTFGSDEQKARYLPPTLRWDIFWGQGFSEPDSGSDLASLKTRAEPTGDGYIVNGSKIWMTDGHFADWLFCLVRTDSTVKKQEGISFLLIDARTAGVDIRPIRSIDGQHTLNQVFFTDVRVPFGNRIGPEGAGWSYAKFLLANERTSSAEVPRCKFYLQRLKQLLGAVERNGRPIRESPLFCRRLAILQADLLALESSVLTLMESPTELQETAAAASVLKLKGSHLLQEMGELMVDMISADAVIEVTFGGDSQMLPAYLPGIVSDFLYRRACTIYGGSAEIQRNIIAASLLSSTRSTI